ncbi:MAG: hypothetical protein H7Y59_12330 [Anaerolineales bacterium]|nr:hypothetical protein [Anaerolineales bacterium]
MTTNILQDNWTDMREQVSEWWDQLTEDDLDLIDGDQDQLLTVLQSRYGHTREAAQAEIERHLAEYDPEDTDTTIGTGLDMNGGFDEDDAPASDKKDLERSS